MKRIALLVSIMLVASTLHAQKNDFVGIKKINGTNLHFRVRGTGTPLVVIHGGPGLNHAYFIPHLNALEKKFMVIYYDQRACGLSAIPSSDSISIKFLLDDLEAIRKEFKIERLNILSHSWGAILATHYALSYPKRVNKLVFSNPAMFNRDYDAEAAALMKKRTTKTDSAAQANILKKGTLDARDYEQIFLLNFQLSAYKRENVQQINLNLPDNFSEANNALFAGLSKDPAVNTDLYDSLTALDFPVLIIHGESDLIPMSAIHRLKEKLPQATLEIFKQSGHFPFVEETAYYNKRVSAFLK